MDDIIARAFRNEATPEELAQLSAWRAASRDNEERFRQTQSVLGALKSAGQRDAFAPPRAVDLLARMERKHAHRTSVHRSRAWIPWGLAAAAMLALAVQLWQTSESQPVAAVAPESTPPAEIITGEGELATVRMPDGSVVRLAPRSRLRLDVTDAERAVWVEGHAFFAVAKDSSRPFRVRTAEGDLIALGTRFDVRTEPDGVRLAVLEGRVALLANGERTEVASGESAAVREGRTSAVARIGDLDEITRWMRRFLAFQDTPLLSVAMEIERVYGRRVLIADASLANETVTATLTDASLEEAVRVVCTVVGVRCAIADSQVTIDR